MASVVRYRDGWRVYLYRDKKRVTKTFRLQSEAKAWAASQSAGKGSQTFAVAAEEFLAVKLPQLNNIKDRAAYEQTIRAHAIPVLGHHALPDIRRTQLVELVRGIAAKGHIETAHRVGQRICSILDFAVDAGVIDSHPAAGLSRVLPAKVGRKMPAIPPEELPALLKAINGYPEPVTRIGLQLLAHTFVRTTELLGARWSELKDDVWVIPEERMKLSIPHVVPLTTQVKALLAELEPMTGDSPFLLASPINHQVPISDNTLLFALYRLGYKGRMTGHGFRAVASSILNESGKWSHDAVERQLAHKETDRVRDSYLRAQFLPERIKMMRWWGSYLSSCLMTQE